MPPPLAIGTHDIPIDIPGELITTIKIENLSFNLKIFAFQKTLKYRSTHLLRVCLFLRGSLDFGTLCAAGENLAFSVRCLRKFRPS